MSTLALVGGPFKAQFVRQGLTAEQWRTGKVPLVAAAALAPPPPVQPIVPPAPQPSLPSPVSIPKPSHLGGQSASFASTVAGPFSSPAPARAASPPRLNQHLYEAYYNDDCSDYSPGPMEKEEDWAAREGLRVRPPSTPASGRLHHSRSCSPCPPNDEPRSLSADARRPRGSLRDLRSSDDADQCPSGQQPRNISKVENYARDVALDILQASREEPDDQVELLLCECLNVSPSTARQIMKNRPRAVPRRAPDCNVSDLASGTNSKQEPKREPSPIPEQDLPDSEASVPFLGVEDVVHPKKAPAPNQSQSNYNHGVEDSASSMSASFSAASSPYHNPLPSSITAPAVAASTGNSATFTVPELLKLPNSDHHMVHVLDNACNMYPQCPTLNSISQLITNEVLDNSELLLIFSNCIVLV